MNEHQLAQSAISKANGPLQKNTVLDNPREYSRREILPPPQSRLTKPAVAADVSNNVWTQFPEQNSTLNGSSSASPSIELNIEQLVLHGFPSHKRNRIARAFKQELARLLTERGFPPSWRASWSVRQLDAGSIHMAADGRAEAVGAQLARSLYREIFWKYAKR